MWGTGARNAERATAVALAILTALCLLDILVPTFGQLGHFDDSAYIRSGYRLAAEETLTEFAWSPLLSALYGVLYVAVQDSPDWFVHSAALGRLAIFALFFLGVYSCARACRAPGTQVPLALGATWLIAADFLQRWNSSDFLFMALSALALSQWLRWRTEASLKRLAYGSACIGLAALTRTDGLILLASFVALALWFRVWSERSYHWSRWWRPAAAASLPALAIMGAYLAVCGVVTGSWETGIPSRTYEAFEQGHGVTFRERHADAAFISSYAEVRALFGTSADNEGSVLRAIARNPGAFLERLRHSLAGLPAKFFEAYGGPLALALFFLAGRGALHLWRRGGGWLLVLLAVWHLHLLSYFVTFWNVRYTKFPFVALTLLAGIGLSVLTSNISDWRERLGVGAAVAGVVLWALIGTPAGTPAVVVVVVLGGIGLWSFASHFWDRRGRMATMAVASIGGVSLVLAAAGASGRLPDWPILARDGTSAEEQAVRVVSEVVPPGTRVVAFGHKVVSAAKRRTRSLTDLLATEASAPALERWRGLDGIGAAFLDGHLRRESEAWFEVLREYFHSDPRFFTAFADAQAHTYLFVRHDAARVMDVHRTSPPALRSEFDVFVLGDVLVYVKDHCRDEDRRRRFFIHVVPADPTDLPARSRARGFENRGFDFAQQGFVEEDRCVAARMLPAYAIDHIRTGQFLPEQGRFWVGRIEFGTAPDDGTARP